MNFLDIILGPFGTKLLDKLIPDPQAKAQAQLEILKMQQAGEFKELDVQLQQNLAQADINKAEATNPSLFVSGWRPYAGWLFTTAIALPMLVGPLLTWIAALMGHNIAFPTVDTAAAWVLLSGMLGLAGARTVEKINGVAAK